MSGKSTNFVLESDGFALCPGDEKMQRLTLIIVEFIGLSSTEWPGPGLQI